MKKYLANFATREFYKSQRALNKSARAFGIDETISYTQRDIKQTNFYKTHRNILDQKRGAGYWLWKPYIILKTLEAASDGDIIVYADSGIEIRADLEPLFELLRKTDILTFTTSGYSVYLNKYLTKRDCFILMDCDSEKYWNAEMRDAGFHLYRKTAQSVAFVKKWLAYAENENILTDKENTEGHNLEGFIDHRHDQSVFSLLAEKEGLEKFRDPSQWGNCLKLPKYRRTGEFLSKPYSDSPYANSPYGTLVDRHRRKKPPLSDRLLVRLRKIVRDIFPKEFADALLPVEPVRPKIKMTYVGKKQDETGGQALSVGHPMMSIVTPSLNQGPYLRQTIESVLEQKGDFAVEYFVVDGGSTDETQAILREYEDRLSWWVQSGKGQSQALNEGFARASGDICAWINSDDYYEPGAFAAVVAARDAHPDTALWCGQCYFKNELTGTKDLRTPEEPTLEHIATRGHRLYQPATFFTKTILDRVGLLDERLNYVMDYDLWVRILSAGTGTRIGKPLATFRIWGKSKTTTARGRFVEEWRAVQKKYGLSFIDPKRVHAVTGQPAFLFVRRHFPALYRGTKRLFYWASARLTYRRER